MRLLSLLLILWVGKLVLPSAYRHATHTDADPFERMNLAPDEAVAHRRVLVDQVSDSNRHVAGLG